MEIPAFPPLSPATTPDTLDPLALLSAWWRAVGGPLAGKASPRGIYRRRLRVAVPDLRWKRVVGEHLEEILARLRRMEGLGGLEGIDLVVEPGPAPHPPGGEAGHRERRGEKRPGGPVTPAGAGPDPGETDRLREAAARILARREEPGEPERSPRKRRP